MAKQLGTRLLACTVTLALTATAALWTPSSAIAAEAPAGNSNVQPTSIGPKPELNGPKLQVPAFNISTEQRVHGRAGGQGLVDISLSRRKGEGVAAKNLTVRLSAPDGVRIDSAAEFTPLHGTDDQAVDWSCAPGDPAKDQICTYVANNGELAPGVIPDPLRAVVKIADSFAPLTARIAATATWSEVKVAEGQTGEKDDTAVGWRDQTFTDGVPLEIDRPLTVDVIGATGSAVHIPATGGSDAQRTGSLVAKIGNIAGRDASAVWSQTAGPTVTLLRPTTVAQPGDSTSQRYVVPAGTPDGTELTFRLVATSNGDEASDSVTVRVRTHTPGTFSPRTELVETLANSTRRSAQGPKSGVKINLNRYRGSISGDGVKHVTATAKRSRSLKALSLKFSHPTGVRSVKWSVESGTSTILKKAKKRGATISLRVPKKAGTWMVRGSAVLKNGTRASRTKIIKVDPVQPKISRTKRAADLRVSAADAASTASFCGLTAGATLKFADGSSLQLPSTYSPPKACTAKSSQKFTGATFTYNGTTFGSANGVLAGSTVRLTSVTFALPAALASALPAGTPTSFTVTPPTSTPVSAKQSKGAWGAWSGSFAVPWLSFLPTPSGWSNPKGKLTLSPTTSKGEVTGAKLSFSQESKASTKATSSSNKGAGGHASFTFTLNSKGASDVTVQAANLAVFQAAAGNQIEFSAKGKFVLSKGGDNAISVAMNCSAPVAGNCPLTSGFALKSGTTISWTQGKGLTLSGAQATIGSGASAYTVALSGTYSSPGSWSLSADNSASPWSIGSTGVTLSNFTGSVSEKPTSGTASDLSVALEGTVNNLNVGSELSVTSMTGNITNQCAANAVNCTPGQISVGIAVDATVDFMSESIPFNATADLDLASMTFQFDASETANVDFGPSALNITSATLTLTNESITGSCSPTGSSSTPSGSVLSLGISAQGTAYGNPVSLGGDVNSDGYCIWGAVGDLNSGAFSGNDVVLAYSSYDNGAQLTLPTNAGDPDAQQASQDTMSLDVAAGMIELQGGYLIPQRTMEDIGIPGNADLTFTAEADVNLSSFTATVDVDLNESVMLGGGSSTNDIGVSVTSASLTIGYSSNPDEASLSFAVNSDIIVDSGSPEGCSADSASAPDACSYTPLTGSIGLTVGGDSTDINIALGMDTPTSNAFGEDGLDVSNLNVSGSIGMGGFAMAVDGAATLPSTWSQDVAVINNAPVAIGFNISEDNPCLQFSIGEEATGQTYLDIANRGVVTASYVALTIAPDGCTIQQGNATQTIPPGYAFAFDGNILSDSVNVNLQVSFDPTIIDAHLEVGSFELAGVLDAQTTLINLTTNSATDAFSLGFTTGFSLGDPSLLGGDVQLNGDVISSSAGNYTLVLGGSSDVNVADVVTANVSSNSSTCPSWTSSLPQPPNNCLVALQMKDGQLSNFDVSANIAISVLDADINGDADLVYSDGDLQVLHLALGAGFNTDVGGVDGTAYIDYCQGVLTDDDHVTGPNSCATGGNSAEVRVEVVGTYYIGDCNLYCYSSSYHDNILRMYT